MIDRTSKRALSILLESTSKRLKPAESSVSVFTDDIKTIESDRHFNPLSRNLLQRLAVRSAPRLPLSMNLHVCSIAQIRNKRISAVEPGAIIGNLRVI